MTYGSSSASDRIDDVREVRLEEIVIFESGVDDVVDVDVDVDVVVVVDDDDDVEGEFEEGTRALKPSTTPLLPFTRPLSTSIL